MFYCKLLDFLVVMKYYSILLPPKTRNLIIKFISK